MSNTLEAIIQEPQTHQRTVIWLHGLGANGHDFEEVCPMLGLEHTRFILPHAPQMPVTLNGGMVMPSWYDIRGLDAQAREDFDGLTKARNWIKGIIEQEIAHGIPASNIALVGFSQGGALALYTSLTCDIPLATCCVLSGYLPCPNHFDEAKKPHGPIFMTHGTLDEVVPMRWAKLSAQKLESIDASVSFEEYPMAHEVCVPQIQAISAWLSSKLPLN